MARSNTRCLEMLSALQNANSILLCTHIAPDGDAVGATLALGLGLRALGKAVTLACADPIPGRFHFLPGAGEFVTAPVLAGKQFDMCLAIDAADLGRLGACGEIFAHAAQTAQMDHHSTNPLYARINWVDGNASASGCVVYRALRELGLEITPAMAQCLYCAISTDTGNFCYRNTTAEAFSIAAELMEAGLPLDQTARTLHLVREEPHVRLLARALGTLRLFCGGKCACMTLTAADYRVAGAGPEHSEKIVNYAMDLAGVEMAYLADCRDPGKVTCSLRPQPPWDVAGIAQKFCGGGHVLAAGFQCAGAMEEVCAAVEKEMRLQAEETI